MLHIATDKYDSCIGLYQVIPGDEIIISGTNYANIVDVAVLVENLENGWAVFSIKQPGFLLLDTYFLPYNTAQNIFFARKKEDKQRAIPHISRAKKALRLRAALRCAKLPTIRCPKRFLRVILYPGEIAVGDYSEEIGDRGWIILETDVKGYLDKLPPIKDSGITSFFWIVYNRNNEITFSKTEVDLSGTAYNAIRVTYDQGSLRIQSLYDQKTQQKTNGVIYQRFPRIKKIRQGDRLPPALRPKRLEFE